MPSGELMMSFFVAAAVFAFTPGPSMLYTAARTIAEGRAAGLRAAIGLHVGGYVHATAAAMGLAVLFDTVPTLYLGLKTAGAVYLIWLGVKLVVSRNSAGAGLDDSIPPRGAASKATSLRAFWQSVAVEILNPKTAIFFLAFLPQFVDPAASLPIWAQLFILGVIVNCMFSVGDIFSLLFADKMVRLFNQSRGAQKLMQRAGGGVLIGLGVHLGLGG